MLISNVLKEMNHFGECRIINEKPFKYLASIESELEQPCCVYFDNDKYIKNIRGTVSIVLSSAEMAQLIKDLPVGLCIVEHPKDLFFKIHNYLAGKENYARNNFITTIGKDCKINPMSSISSNNVKIGNGVTIEEFVVIRGNTFIGDNSIIRSGCVIGGHGYEFKRKEYGIESVAHAGGVFIGRNVEIQYNTCIDRAVFPWDDTIIGDYCKIDNLVHIAHGVKIDKNVMVVANVGIGGRTTIGEDSWIGFAATLINGIKVGENARANIGSVVTKSVPDNSSVTGNFAIEHKVFIENLKKSLG